MKTLNNERGAILITVLLLIVIVTLIGIVAINLSTVDIQISGQTKRASIAFEGAEAGVDLAIPVIENSLANSALTPPISDIPKGIISKLSDDVGDEILTDAAVSDPDFETDVTISKLNGVDVEVDIDMLYKRYNEGADISAGQGYEGIGLGAAQGGFKIIYRIDARGTL